MRQGIKKTFQYILVFLLILISGFVLYTVTGYRGDYPEGSSYHTGEAGIKAIYLLSRQMGYQTRRYHYPAKFLADETVMIAYRPNTVLFNEPEEQQYLKEWLLKGNTLILIPDEKRMKDLWIFNMISEQRTWHEAFLRGNITTNWYGLDQGAVCVIDSAESFINTNLNQSDAGVVFIRALEKTGSKSIVFNENYHYLQKSAPNLWELIGTAGQLVAVQLLLVLLLFGIRGWKPFGPTRDEKKWVKRPENELLSALAGLYIRMKAYPLVLSNYYGAFIHRYGRLLEASGSIRDRAFQTLAACERWIESGGGTKKEMFLLMQRLQKVEDEIKKGMKRVWK